MNETPHGASKVTAIACALAVLLVMLVALFMLRDRLRAEMHETTRAQSSAQEKLSAQLDTLKASVDALAVSTPPAGESQTALEAKLVAMEVTMDALAARLEAMEKKPLEVKPESLPVVITPAPAQQAATVSQGTPTNLFTRLALVALSGKPYAAELDAWEKTAALDAKTLATLRAFAQSGIPSDAEIIRQLRTMLDTPTREASGVDDVSMVGKINTHLAGLVSIKKSGTDKNDAYMAVRAALEQADIARLIASVEQLDEPARAPLNAWLSTAKTRADALSIVTSAHHESSP